MKDLLLSQPGSGEEALTIAETLIRSNALDVIVVDSVAALTPRAELEGQVAPPFTEAEFDIMYNEGISKESSILDLATEMEVVEKKGAWLAFGGEMIGQGREAARVFLKENSPISDKIIAAVYAKRSLPKGAEAAQVGARVAK